MKPESDTILDKFTVVERAVLYARVSGDDRGQEGRNLAGQIEMGREFAQGKSYNIVAEFREDDRGASGYEIDLPELNKIRDMARSGQFDVLIVRELDRLSRNLAKQLIVEEELRRAGVRIEYVLAEYADTPEGRLQKHIRATVAEYEREKIKERMTRGRRNKAKAGKVIRTTKRPYGLDFSQDDNFVIAESEARIVRNIFAWCLEGQGTAAIAKNLNDLGIPTPAGGKQWHASSVLFILKNRTYTGVWEFGKASRVNGKWIQNPEESRIKIDIPAIIDPETFEQVQAQLKANQRLSRRNTQRFYLVSKRLTCQCGAAVVAVPVTHPGQETLLYYRCRAKYRPYQYGHTCELPTFRTEEVDNKVWAELEEYAHDPEKLKKGLLGYQQETSGVTRPLQERISIIDDSLTHWQAEWKNTMANIRAVKSDEAKAVFGEELSRIEKTITDLKAERAVTLARLEEQSLSDQQIDSTVAFFRQMADDWEVLSKDPESRRMVIDLLDVQITLMIVDGKRQGIMTAKLPGGPVELCFDDSETPFTVTKAQRITLTIVLDFDRES